MTKPNRVYTQAFAVASAIIEKDGKFLLVQEANGMDKDKWNQPSGLIEIGENPIEAIKREVKEETGYDFDPKSLLGLYSIVRERLRDSVPAGVPHGVKIVFLGSISDHADSLHEDVSQTAWFSPQEVYAMDQHTLRDVDVKQEIKDFLAGKSCPLDLVHHTVEPKNLDSAPGAESAPGSELG